MRSRCKEPKEMFEWKMPEAREGEKGFTLIEMSIVLVIIGLIIGGVLKGQELIGSTRLKSVITQWDAYKAAINAFQDRFVGLPGDIAGANTIIATNGVGTGTGNANGVIGAVIAANLYTTDVNGVAENLEAWAHLAAAGMITGVRVNGAGTAVFGPAAGGVPEARVGGTTFAMLHATSNTKESVWVRFQRGNAGAPAADAITVKEAAEIDRKFDDNSAINGSIHAGNANGTAACTAADGVYNAINTARNCSLMLDLF
jgi:prepilin-type N-terminal cleavage/methylation domain-containing protein